MTTSSTTLPTAPPTAPRRRRRWPGVIVALALALLILSVVATRVTLSEYALVPGQAQSVAGLLTVPDGRGHPVHGVTLLTDVGVDPVTLASWLPDQLNSDTQVVPEDELTGNLPVSEFNAEGTVDMEESQLTANAVALRQLGYPVPEHDAGVTVYVIDPGSPAWHALHIGDVITAVDATPTTNPDAVAAAIHALRPGDTVTLTVGSIDHPQAGHPVRVRLGSTPGRGGAKTAFLGIGAPDSQVGYPWGTQPAYQFPFEVHINSDNIGGPSAGLAFTLGILNSLSGGDLTGGRIIAATGTIRPDGSVGDVGGVAQKTVAVERAHATVFLVPQVELATARAHATPGLTVLGVTSLDQALRDLQRLGGHLGSAATGPPPGAAGHSTPTDWPDSPWVGPPG
jgi:Lon-like protease